MTTLTLHAVSITVPDQRVTYNNIRKKYQRLAEAAADSFAANFTATFKNMDDIHNKCTEQFIPMLRETAEVAVQDIVAHGIYDIRKAVKAMGAGTLLKPAKPKRLSTLDLKISLKYRR